MPQPSLGVTIWISFQAMKNQSSLICLGEGTSRPNGSAWFPRAPTSGVGLYEFPYDRRRELIEGSFDGTDLSSTQLGIFVGGVGFKQSRDRAIRNVKQVKGVISHKRPRNL